MKTSVWTTLTSSIFNRKDRSSPSKNKAITNALSGKLNVNEEYKQAFRTKSYIEFTTTNKDNTSSSSSSCLLEPDQELLNNVFRSCNGSRVHRLLVDYFETSFEAFKICQLLLQAVDKTRVNHGVVNGVIKLVTRAFMSDKDDLGYNKRELLSSFSQIKNPFSTLIHSLFLGLHTTHSELLRKLSIERSEARRKLRLKTDKGRKQQPSCFIISNVTVLIASLVLALHSLVGSVAAPGLILCFTCSSKKKKRGHKVSSRELVVQKMEVASRATYITMNDLDTLSRMAARLDGEVEHLRVVGEMWMRSGRRPEILKEVVKEFVAEEDAIVEQMKELQQHIYLCFLTINRSRRLVMNELVEGIDQIG